jgi:cytochrome c peroxidase
MKSISLIGSLLVFILASMNATQSRDKGLLKLKTSAELGEKLFFDPILSKDQTVSCASCHKPQFAFSDNRPLSKGINGIETKRNTPSIMYPELSELFFWDGRAQTLEHQAFFPITNPDEMGMRKDDVIKRLSENDYYLEAFKMIFNDKPDIINISTALADFQKTLSFYAAPFDRFYLGDDNAISPAAIRGLRIFYSDKAGCVQCHSLGTLKTDAVAYKNIGLYNASEYNDRGIFDITQDSVNIGEFKSPSLRNIELTAPYMHDGSMNTLDDVIDYYDQPSKKVKGAVNINKVLLVDSIGLSGPEKADLKEFLLTLTDDSLSFRFSRFLRNK